MVARCAGGCWSSPSRLQQEQRETEAAGAASDGGRTSWGRGWGLAAEARAALDGALLAQRTRRPGIPLGEEAYLATMVLQWTACEEGFSLLLRGGLLSVAARSRLDLERVTDAETRPSQVVGRPSVFGGAEAPAWGWEPVDGSLQPFQLTVMLYGAALCA